MNFMMKPDSPNIVIPLAGDSMRFQQISKVPKYLMEIKGRRMIEWATDYIDAASERLIFVPRYDHQKEYDVKAVLKDIFGSAIQIVMVEPTGGPAQTVLACRDLIDNDTPLVIRDCDCIINAPIKLDEGVDGQVTYYSPASEPMEAQLAKSYVSIGHDGMAKAIREKEVISEHALCGMYVFGKGSDFVKTASEAVSESQKVSGEYYVAPLLDKLIEDGKKIIAVQAQVVIDLGTPKNVERFESSYE
jgi:NDP-sugar pyrophosphorylase family protein